MIKIEKILTEGQTEKVERCSLSVRFNGGDKRVSSNFFDIF